MVRGLQTISARQALRVVLAGGLLLVLAADLPGHMSYDTVAQLYEGHFHVRETWGPAIYAWLLGLADAVVPGVSLMVAAGALLFFATLAGLADLRGRISWLAVGFAVLMILTPQVLIYQGIVWKDIAFADSAIAATGCLAQAFARWDRPRVRWPWLAAALVLFGLASTVRQNGVLVPLVASLALGVVGSRGQWRRFAAWTGGGLVALVAMMQLITVFAVPAPHARDGALKDGVRIVQNYDLVGAVTLDPTYRLTEIEKAHPAAAATIRRRGPLNWSPDRIDFLDRDKLIGDALIAVPNDIAQRQWLSLIFQRPDLYLRMRWNDFAWLFLSPNPDRCLPIYTGVDAPADKMAPLNIAHRFSKSDQQLTNYDSFYVDTPLQRHWTYAIAALVVAGLLLWRRQPADLAVAALMLGVLAVTASFFVITIACDYRYLYILDLSALVGVFYVLADPTGFRRRAGTG
ncbi:MAG: hypothetical protein JWP49_2744 [Phenylobacterium sp.]|nr:hypothetical protein [Phenylobacterium sp.]